MSNQAEKKDVEKTTPSNVVKSGPSGFCPHKIAIDVYNGLYGFYSNEQRRLLANKKYTSDQISEIMSIVETIGR